MSAPEARSDSGTGMLLLVMVVVVVIASRRFRHSGGWCGGGCRRGICTRGARILVAPQEGGAGAGSSHMTLEHGKELRSDIEGLGEVVFGETVLCFF